MPNTNEVDNKLGEQIREFKVAGSKNKANRFFGRAFSCLGAFLIVTGVVCLVRSSEIGWLWLGLGATLALAGAYALWEFRSDSATRINLHQRGISYQKRGKKQSICWEEVQAIHTSARRIRLRRASKVNFDISHTVKLIGARDKVEFSMNKNSMPKVGELVSLIEKAVATHQLPHASAQMEQGQTVDFGALTLSSQGIGHAGDFLKWEQFRDISYKNGFVIIRTCDEQGDRSTEWARVDQFRIANLIVLRMLVSSAVETTLA